MLGIILPPLRHVCVCVCVCVDAAKSQIFYFTAGAMNKSTERRAVHMMANMGESVLRECDFQNRSFSFASFFLWVSVQPSQHSPRPTPFLSFFTQSIELEESTPTSPPHDRQPISSRYHRLCKAQGLSLVASPRKSIRRI